VLILAVLACLGWRRTAAAFAAVIPLAYLGIALTSGFTLLAAPRGDGELYLFGLEALVLLAAPGTPRGWRALRWRPSALLAAATVAAGVANDGGVWPLMPHSPFRPPASAFARAQGIVAGGWGNWLLYQGTLVAVIVVALAIMLLSSPVNRRVLFLLGVPFALGAVIYLCSRVSPAPSGLAGNTLAALPLLLILLTAIAFWLLPRLPGDPNTGDSSEAFPG
jgi:hypothetical protein